MKKIAEWGEFEFLGPDMLRHEKYGDEKNHGDDKALWVDLRSRVAVALKEGKTVVVDSTFHTAKRREHFIEHVRANGVKTIEGLYFDIPLETLVSRSTGRHAQGGKKVTGGYIETVYQELQDNLPKLEEGFDTLMRIDENGIVACIECKPGNVLEKYFADQKGSLKQRKET